MSEFAFFSEQDIEILNKQTLEKIQSDTEELARQISIKLLERIVSRYRYAYYNQAFGIRALPPATTGKLGNSLMITEKPEWNLVLLHWLQYGYFLEKGAPPTPNLPFNIIYNWVKNKIKRYNINLKNPYAFAKEVHEKLKKRGYVGIDLLWEIIKSEIKKPPRGI